MELSELKKRSRAAQRRNAYIETNLESICKRVRQWPGKTAHWHYGSSVQRNRYYEAFARARRHDLIKGLPGEKSGETVYFLTSRGKEFLEL